MKRASDSQDEASAKALKIDNEALQKVQNELTSLDDACREEQVAVQCKYDAMKKKHFEERGELLKKIPSFWKDVFLNFAGPHGLLLEQEVPVLEHLVDVRLEDNLDKKGSHKFTFTFTENDYFNETEIVKEIAVSPDDKAEVKVTPITWKKNILAEVPHEEGDLATFFRWLQSSEEDCEGDFGSMFRESVWEDALQIYANPPEDVEGEEEEGEE